MSAAKPLVNLCRMETALHEALLYRYQQGQDPSGLSQPLAKKLRYHLPSHLAQGDKLFYMKRDKGMERLLKVPRQEQLPAILEMFHASRYAGHFKVQRTLLRLQEVFYWKGMVADITKFCAHCETCLVKQVYPRIATIQELTPIPVTRVGIDLMGPLVETVEGHRFIAVAIDYLTKWVEVRPLVSKDSENIAQFVLNQVIMTHSCPIEILSDNGSKFCNILMDVVMLQMNIKHVTTSPYHPQCNGLTERFNHTLCALLEKNGEYDDRWHEMVLAIVFVYRTSVQSSTGYSPFELFYGGKPSLSMHGNTAKVVGSVPENFEEYVAKFLD
jgi:hypothetical protein